MKILILKSIILLICCVGGSADSTTSSAAESFIFEFGIPELFITSDNQAFDPYRQIDKRQLTFIENEYILCESDKDKVFKLSMLIYDPAAEDIVRQNLGKEQYWTFINSTGVLPSVTLLNTTTKRTTKFKAITGDVVQYVAEVQETFESVEAIPPIDAVFEIPAESETFYLRKTVINYHSWGFLSWRWSLEDPMTWTEIKKKYESLHPEKKNTGDATKAEYDLTVNEKDFKHLTTPCIPDIFIVYIIVGDKGDVSDNGEVDTQGKNSNHTSTNRIFINIPIFNIIGKTDKFYDITTAFCSDPRLKDCGNVEQVALTNDHFVVLTDKGLYVSTSLNISSVSSTLEYTEKPLLGFVLMDPCIAVNFPCIEQHTLDTHLKVKMHYHPVCSLNQEPNYRDALILTTVNSITENNTISENKGFTVLYSFTPYKDWFPLFVNKYEYNGTVFSEIIGIFFNHQLLHFDITVKINDKFRRFVLPIPTDVTRGHADLSPTLNNGFAQFDFPVGVGMRELKWNSYSTDLYFIGKQLWIAESAGSLVYQSMGGLPRELYIKDCQFNHPDRYFMCVNEDSSQLLIGRTAYQYSLEVVDIKKITYLKNTFIKLGWPGSYAETIIKKAIFRVGFSGNILMWYLFDSEELKKHETKRNKNCNPKDPPYPEVDEEYCKKFNLNQNKKRRVPVSVPDKTGKHAPFFKMLSLDPQQFSASKVHNEGPLTPFIVDSSTVILYEGKVHGGKFQLYFSTVSIGQKIYCKETDTSKPEDERKDLCELYITHVKNIAGLLDGFQLAIYTSVVKSIPMTPINTVIDITVREHTNTALIDVENIDLLLESDSLLSENDKLVRLLGKSIYFPGYFSVLITGFRYKDKHKLFGRATLVASKKFKKQIPKLEAYLIDLSTEPYQKNQVNADIRSRQIEHNAVDSPYPNIRAIRLGGILLHEAKQVFLANRNTVCNDCQLLIDNDIAEHLKYDPVDREDLGTLTVPESPGRFKPEKESPFLKYADNKKKITYESGDGGCHHVLRLKTHPFLKAHGGVVTLDRLDSISFVVTIEPTTPIGKIMLYRPLLVLTNSNPDILVVNKIFTRSLESQTMKIHMRPFGIGIGVSTVIIRSVVASTNCETPSSFTFTVKVHRAAGRRLHIKYPYDICNFDDVYPRPWHTDEPDCVKGSEIVNSNEEKITRDKQDVFITLPVNYRPPSYRGAEVPVSRNVYNAHPNESGYKELYTLSKRTKKFDSKFCLGKANRTECKCSDTDKLQRDEIYSDCIEKVFVVKRGDPVPFKVLYDPIMRDEDQLSDFISTKSELAVYVEEVNGRTEFAVTDKYSGCDDDEDDEVHCSELLTEINSKPELNKGRRFFGGESIQIVVYGSGLFHFRIGLAKFDTFEDVTGYFMIYCEANDLNDVKLMVVMFLTLTVCFGLLFFGFLRVRKRLTAHLPYRSKETKKIKVD